LRGKRKRKKSVLIYLTNPRKGEKKEGMKSFYNPLRRRGAKSCFRHSFPSEEKEKVKVYSTVFLHGGEEGGLGASTLSSVARKEERGKRHERAAPKGGGET